jgi:hypothetical protein
MRVGVTDRYHSMSAIQIKVLGALIVVNQTPNTFYDVDRVDWVYIK